MSKENSWRPWIEGVDPIDGYAPGEARWFDYNDREHEGINVFRHSEVRTDLAAVARDRIARLLSRSRELDIMTAERDELKRQIDALLNAGAGV